MDTFEAIQKRRSVREYTGEPIPKEDLHKIIDAARVAPSGNNQQTWHFVVVTDNNIIQRLGKAGDWMVKASAVIVVVMAPDTAYWVEDGSAAIENILLAATALGYGSCWVQGNAKPLEAEFKLLLNIPEHLNLLTLIPIGIPVEWPSQPDKKALDAILHWETFK
ncbi:MAG: nitroreductase family protein [Anaerolineae bacterium]|jgi:nitroreductase|nr:nitroreductase family protein [Anaerolineae bacterium]